MFLILHLLSQGHYSCQFVECVDLVLDAGGPTHHAYEYAEKLRGCLDDVLNEQAALEGSS